MLKWYICDDISQILDRKHSRSFLIHWVIDRLFIMKSNNGKLTTKEMAQGPMNDKARKTG